MTGDLRRRDLLKAALGTGVALEALRSAGAAEAQEKSAPAPAESTPAFPEAPAATPPDQLAVNEAYWSQIRALFPLDPTIVNLNNGGVTPSPRSVVEAVTRAIEASNRAPAYNLWRVLEPEIENVRKRLAATVGSTPAELAITRNASEALEICQLGLPLAAGDEILTTEQDYPRTLNTWRQRARRDGIVVKTISVAPAASEPDDVTAAFERAITPRTRAILFCHVLGVSGRVLPAREICKMAREKNVATIVDGAHAFAHVPLNVKEIDCDFYCTSLHKWFLGPTGTGFLHVRRDRLRSLWPLMAAVPEQDDDIHKLEQIGTHPAAAHNAILAALDFHEGLGFDRKRARLRFLRERWTHRLSPVKGAAFFTSPEAAQAPGMGLVAFAQVDHLKLVEKLFQKHRILVSYVACPPGIAGIRVSPTVCTSAGEIDAFCEAVERELSS